MSAQAKNASPLDLHSPLRYRGFCRYVNYYFAKNFSGVRVLNKDNAVADSGRQVIYFSNHSAWWDAIMMHLLASNLVADRKPFAPMDQAALEHYRFMKRIGMFGVDQTPRGAVIFLKTARDLLARDGTSLWLTPQGEFRDPRSRPLQFKPGLAHLARDQQAVLIPLALEYCFWEERKPEALINFGSPIDTKAVEQRTVDGWANHLEEQLAVTMDELAATAMAREPDRFHTLISGTAGINPLYDAWRLVSSVVTGKKWSRRHRDIST